MKVHRNMTHNDHLLALRSFPKSLGHQMKAFNAGTFSRDVDAIVVNPTAGSGRQTAFLPAHMG